MKRGKRIALELLGPPLLGALLWWVVLRAIDRSGRSGVGSWEVPSYMVAWAYLCAGIPSILSTLTMEVGFSHGLNAGSWAAAAFSGFLGAVAGVSMIVVLTGCRFETRAVVGFGELGLVVGLILGLIIKFSLGARKSTPEHST